MSVRVRLFACRVPTADVLRKMFPISRPYHDDNPDIGQFFARPGQSRPFRAVSRQFRFRPSGSARRLTAVAYTVFEDLFCIVHNRMMPCRPHEARALK